MHLKRAQSDSMLERVACSRRTHARTHRQHASKAAPNTAQVQIPDSARAALRCRRARLPNSAVASLQAYHIQAHAHTSTHTSSPLVTATGRGAQSSSPEHPSIGLTVRPGAHGLKSSNTFEGMGSDVPAWARSLWCGWGRRGTSTGFGGTSDARHPAKGNRSGVRRARKPTHISAPYGRGNCIFDLRISVFAFYTPGAGQRCHRGGLRLVSTPPVGKGNRIPIIRGIPIFRQVTDTLFLD
jgi:hypothetical protein